MMHWTMNKLLIALLIIVIFSGTVNAFRMGKPAKLKYPIDEGQVAKLNNVLEVIWDITNGRYGIEAVSTVPATGLVGEMRVYHSGSTYRLYIFIDGWKYITLN